VCAYQRRFPDDLVGVVFVDGTHDEGITFMSAGKRMPISVLSAEELRVAFAQYEKEAPRPGAEARSGTSGSAVAGAAGRAFLVFKKLVDEVGLLPKGLAAAESRRQEFTALRRERVDRPPAVGNLPLIVLERGSDRNETWHTQQLDLAALSRAGRLVTVESAAT
jgi:hypothetical protein